MTDIHFKSVEHVIDEVRNMNVKGGSPFGRAAACAYKLAAEQESFATRDDFQNRVDWIAQQLHSLKPTMATIHNTEILIKEHIAGYHSDVPVKTIQDGVAALCVDIIDHSIKAVESLGVYGANCIEDGMVVLMHSYTSSLMSIYEARAKRNHKFEVICTESRPLRESRLAASILQQLHIPVTFITDASVWEFLPKADIILMGADSIACDGSVANKMGTAQIARLAQDVKKDVLIASELFKLDGRTMEGYPIELERRTPGEVVSEGDFPSMDGITVVNQFFDLTPAAHIRYLITEYGLIAPSNVMLYWDRLKDRLLNGIGMGGAYEKGH